MAHSARTRLHTRGPGPSHTRSRHFYEEGSRELPPGKPEERWRGFLRGQLLHLVELVLRVVLAPQGTPQTAQAVVRIGLGRVQPDRLAELADGLVGIVLCGEKDAKVEVREPHFRIQCQRASKGRFA